MKKLVPFKKDIVFDTNIDEINSISLEYELDEKQNSLITGKFIISGDYRMVSNSENLDIFNYELPFNINIDKKYNIDDADIDISDFYYEVINNKILSVNIELSVDNIEEIIALEKEEEKVEEKTVDSLEEVKNEDVMDEDNERCIEPEDTPVKSIFDNLDDNENYATYKIHIVTENDTKESIMEYYSVSSDELENYNNLSEIKIGDKIIIPNNEN